MVTLKDIAREAGVSITTVSNVVHNRKSRVSPETIAKIWGIIQRERYVPSMSARSLANNHSSIIGVITHLTPQSPGSTVSDPFLSVFVDSIEKRIREEGYRELVLTGIEVASYGVDLPGHPGLAVANHVDIMHYGYAQRPMHGI